MSKWNMIIDVGECTNCQLCTLSAAHPMNEPASSGEMSARLISDQACSLELPITTPPAEYQEQVGMSRARHGVAQAVLGRRRGVTPGDLCGESVTAS